MKTEYSISFGYLNANEDTLVIPLGDGNFSTRLSTTGCSPRFFIPDTTGIFTGDSVGGDEDQDVRWTLRKANSDVTSVPGRVSSNAYELDWVPRPHGSLPPSVPSTRSPAWVGDLRASWRNVRGPSR